MENIKHIKYGLFTSILIALGPILWLFLNLYDKNYDAIELNVVAIILTMGVVLFNLKNYLKVYSNKGNITLEILSHVVSFIFYIFMIVIVIIGFIVFYLGIALIQEKLFLKGQYYTYMIKSPYSYLIFVILVIVASRIGLGIGKDNKKDKDYLLSKKINRYAMIAIIPLVYIVITSVVVVTEDGIYDYSFYNLKGTKYSYSEVKNIDTGFIDSGRNKGEFYYNIELENGRKLHLAHPSLTQPSPNYDTWQEYVDIDKRIMNSGAKKEASESGAKFVQMDQKYTDKLLSVIRNK